MEHAKQLSDPDVRKEYLLTSESLFVDAAAEVPQNYKKSEYYKYATITAKMAGRNPKTVLDYATIALRYRSLAHSEIDSFKRELKKHSENSELKLLGVLVAAPFMIEICTLTLGNKKVENAVGNVIEKTLGMMNADERETKQKVVNEFSHPSDCYSVCTKMKEQAEQAIAESKG